MNGASSIRICLASTRDQHCVDLLERQQQEIWLTNPTLTPFSADIPIFFVVTRKGDAIACGGLRPLPDSNGTAAEVKRVYVVPEARGRKSGVGDVLIEHLQLYAIQQGWTTLRLQTSRDMVAANRFYGRHGFRLIPNYGDYLDCAYTISFEKGLS